ncbi:MAG: hypothetical protein U0412_05790 [Nitrospira sp.]
MTMTRMMMAVALASMVLVPTVFAESGKGKTGTAGTATPGTPSTTDVRLVAKLVPTTSQDPTFEGHAARRTGAARDEFEARVEVPLALLGEVDPADVHPDLVLAGAVHCTMVFDEVEPVTGVAEYKVSVRSRNGVITNRAGSCGAVPTIPAVNAGDTASVSIGGDVLHGVFAAKR